MGAFWHDSTLRARFSDRWSASFVKGCAENKSGGDGGMIGLGIWILRHFKCMMELIPLL
jgi:hypothetical protein